MSSLKFGTSGLRGLVSDLDGRPAYAYARAFAAMIRDEQPPGTAASTVLIGRDLRASSPAIARRVAQGIADAGLVPRDCGALPTPALALAAIEGGHAAIMVTGSHIPDDRNGLKFYRSGGEIDKADEARILEQHSRLAGVEAPSRGVDAPPFDALTAYRARYRTAFAADALAGLTVGVYQHSSVGRDLIAEMIEALGGTAVPLGRAEAFIPVDTEALRQEDIDLARGWAGAQRLDAIVSTDGDADRPLIADEAGLFLRGDLVGAMTAAYLGAASIVTPVTSNSALERCGRFAHVRRSRVGSPYVIAEMLRVLRDGQGPVVGFEANGGVLLGSDIVRDSCRVPALATRDAMLPILAVLATMRAARRPLSALAADYAFAHALSNRLQEVPSERSLALIARLTDDAVERDRLFAAHGGISGLDGTDGLRLTTGRGEIVHFRASGNAPELRVYVEADTADHAEALLAFGLAIAEQARG